MKTQKIQESEESLLAKKINQAIKKLTTRVKKLCKDPKVGLSVMKIQLEFIKDNNTRLPDITLSKEQTVSAFQEGIRYYLEELQFPKVRKNKKRKGTRIKSAA